MGCTRCGKSFRLTEPGVTEQLPIDVQSYFDSDAETPNAPRSRWGDTLSILGLALAAGVAVTYTIIREGRTIRRSDRRIEVHAPLDAAGNRDLDADVIHLAMHVDREGRGVHFSATREAADTGTAGTGALTAYQIRHKISTRATSFDHIAAISQLKDVAATPFDAGPAGADERALFLQMHKSYTRKSSASYDRFMAAWSTRVLEEYAKRRRGEPHKKLRLKTNAHLYAEYDRIYVEVDAADDLAPEDNANMRAVYQQQRAAREANVAPPAAPAGRVPVPLPPPGARVPLPWPAMMPFGGQLVGAPPTPGIFPFGRPGLAPMAPWGFVPPRPPPPAPPPPPDGRAICAVCGRRRREHARGAYGRGKCTQTREG
mmetsp:Transcript_3389/g.9940  ORF Transcript_3389/g.9940 Transcript_3389/m.9940 type:complete len:372 (+) Transcript_3389:427-1542(+)